MKGLITSRHVVEHFPLIWRSFGARCALRCLGALFSTRPTTFLDVVFRVARRPR